MKNLATNENQLNEIKKFIQTELLKRGFQAPIISIEEVEGRSGNRIEFKTESFQTFPILFEEIVVENFNSAIFEEEINGEMIKAFSISIHASYRHFGYGGSNGCNLFGVRGLIHDGRVFDMKAQ